MSFKKQMRVEEKGLDIEYFTIVDVDLKFQRLPKVDGDGNVIEGTNAVVLYGGYLNKAQYDALEDKVVGALTIVSADIPSSVVFSIATTAGLPKSLYELIEDYIEQNTAFFSDAERVI
jgi:hypothetical protein